MQFFEWIKVGLYYGVLFLWASLFNDNSCSHENEFVITIIKLIPIIVRNLENNYFSDSEIKKGKRKF